MRIGAYLAGAILYGLVFAAQGYAEEVSKEPIDVDALLARMEAQTPDEPAGVTPELTLLINEVGATKRLDAAMLLIRALSLSFNPIGSGESRSMFGLLPSAEAIKRNYGKDVLPLLMYSGVTAEKPWLQIRIALVIREMGSESEVQTLKQVFSVDKAVKPSAKEFANRLTEPVLRVTEDPVLSLAKEVESLIDKALKEKQRVDKERKPPGV